jgi:26S proteasome regulatory subunit N11
MKELVGRYDAAVVEERELSPEARLVANVGKMDAKKHLAANVTSLMSSNINQVGRVWLCVCVGGGGCVAGA